MMLFGVGITTKSIKWVEKYSNKAKAQKSNNNQSNGFAHNNFNNLIILIKQNTIKATSNKSTPQDNNKTESSSVETLPPIKPVNVAVIAESIVNNNRKNVNSSTIRFSFISSVLHLFKISVVVVMSSVLFESGAFAKTCTGRMINPITDICWECMFPITIGAIPVVIGTRADTINPPSPVCVCPGKIVGLPQVGMTIGLWEGIRLIDVTKSPFCFENKLLFLSLIFAVLRWCEFGWHRVGCWIIWCWQWF